jgi:hypothetical protein
MAMLKRQVAVTPPLQWVPGSRAVLLVDQLLLRQLAW